LLFVNFNLLLGVNNRQFPNLLGEGFSMADLLRRQAEWLVEVITFTIIIFIVVVVFVVIHILVFVVITIISPFRPEIPSRQLKCTGWPKITKLLSS
jgi:hypothetical protein